MPHSDTTNPADYLMNLVVALLAPMFLRVTNGDLALSRRAAANTIASYRAQNHSDLIAIVQIVAYGLAALSSLSLSMADDLSLNMTLRLRGNANACTRSAEQNRRALTRVPAEAPIADWSAQAKPPDPDPQDPVEPMLNRRAETLLAAEARTRLRQPEPQPKPKPVIQPEPVSQPKPNTLAQPVSDKRTREMWAIVRAKEAADLHARIPHLPPDERKAATHRAAALSSTAHDLLTGIPVGIQPFKL